MNCGFCGTRLANYRCYHRKCGFVQCHNCINKSYFGNILLGFFTFGFSLLFTGFVSKTCVNCKRSTLKKI